MNKIQKEILEMIKSERNYDKSCIITGISKNTENTALIVAEEENIEYEEAIEYLIEMGSNYHFQINRKEEKTN